MNGEGGQFVIGDPARTRFGGLPQQFTPGAAEYQKSRAVGRSVHKHPEETEEFRAMLDLVNDDQSFEMRERQLGIGEPGLVGRILHVEECDRVRLPCDQAAGQRGLSDLARAHETHYGELAE